MSQTSLADGTPIHCLRRSEALVLDQHVAGYFDHGVTLRDGDVVMDVGANVGVFAVRALQRFPRVRVVALEPVPDIFEVLKRNAQDFGDGRLVALRVGAGQQPGELSFTYYPNSPALSTSKPGLFADNEALFGSAVEGAIAHAPVWYARLVPRFLSGIIARYLRMGAREVRAELRPISQILREQGLDRVDLLKVDCEGAELDALRGIDDEHWPHIRQVVAEVQDIDGRLAEVKDLLMRHGLTRMTVAQEPGFETTSMYNVYAVRPTEGGEA